MVYLNIKSLQCGGTLIRPDAILTASHCFGDPPNRDIPPSFITAKISQYDLGNSSENALTLQAKSYTLNNCYSPGVYQNFDYDVAVIFLAENVSSSVTSPVTLYNPSSSPFTYDPGTVNVTAIGWGDTETSAFLPTVLKYVTLPSITDAECSAVYGALFSPEMTCAYEDGGGKDTCQGDSGGPLVYYPAGGTTGTAYQVGVTSWGVGCADAGYPGVYAYLGNAEISAWVEGTADGADMNAQQTQCANKTNGCLNVACNGVDCLDGVYTQADLGNGVCNEPLNCLQYLYDYGDCDSAGSMHGLTFSVMALVLASSVYLL